MTCKKSLFFILNTFSVWCSGGWGEGEASSEDGAPVRTNHQRQVQEGVREGNKTLHADCVGP